MEANNQPSDGLMADGVNRYHGHSLISNRLSNRKHSGRSQTPWTANADNAPTGVAGILPQPSVFPATSAGGDYYPVYYGIPLLSCAQLLSQDLQQYHQLRPDRFADHSEQKLGQTKRHRRDSGLDHSKEGISESSGGTARTEMLIGDCSTDERQSNDYLDGGQLQQYIQSHDGNSGLASDMSVSFDGKDASFEDRDVSSESNDNGFPGLWAPVGYSGNGVCCPAFFYQPSTATNQPVTLYYIPNHHHCVFPARFHDHPSCCSIPCHCSTDPIYLSTDAYTTTSGWPDRAGSSEHFNHRSGGILNRSSSRLQNTPSMGTARRPVSAGLRRKPTGSSGSSGGTTGSERSTGITYERGYRGLHPTKARRRRRVRSRPRISTVSSEHSSCRACSNLRNQASPFHPVTDSTNPSVNSQSDYIQEPTTYCFLSLTKDNVLPRAEHCRTATVNTRCSGCGLDNHQRTTPCHSSFDRLIFREHPRPALRRNSHQHSRKPLITIAVPPNCQIVHDDESIQLSTSFNSSTTTSSSFDEPGGADSSDDLGEISSNLSDLELRASPESSVCSSDFSDHPLPSHYALPFSYLDANHSGYIRVNPTPLPPRQWISLDEVSNEYARFMVMCYNVLCDKYAVQSQYSYCPSWALAWEYRKTKIMEEIRRYNADIVSLQEIETAEYSLFFEPTLAKEGYDGIFSPKSRAKTMSEEERKYVDGCAIFWKREKFELVRKHLIEFTQLAIAYAEGSELMLNRVMTRDNIALAAVLRVKEKLISGRDGDNTMLSEQQTRTTGSPLVVCAAHIHWDPEFCDVKLIQVMMLIQECRRILELTGASWGADASMMQSGHPILQAKDVPLLLCGDLNSLPESGVFEFLSKSRVPSGHEDFKDFIGDPCLQNLSMTSPAESPGYFLHSLDISSAYSPTVMPFTNYTYDFRGVIDYIFASRRILKRTGVLGPLDMEWFGQNKVYGCPHPLIPSDHISLVAEYALIPPPPRPTVAPSADHPGTLYYNTPNPTESLGLPKLS